MKNYITIGIAALGLIISCLILGSAVKNRNKSDNTISVTGLGTKKFTSDLITWNASFSRSEYNMQDAYEYLANDRRIISEYLKSKNVKSSEIVYSAVDIQKLYTDVSDGDGNYRQSRFSGYSLTQTVSIESKEVSKIENLSRTVTDIINKGIELTSSQPQYFYTKLADVKQEMIAEGTKDARDRAKKIAENAGVSLGKLKKASMGVIQITAPNSGEDYSWGGAFNTTSKEKEASITIKLEYAVR